MSALISKNFKDGIYSLFYFILFFIISFTVWELNKKKYTSLGTNIFWKKNTKNFLILGHKLTNNFKMVSQTASLCTDFETWNIQN